MLDLFLLFMFFVHVYLSDKEHTRIWKILIDQDYRLKDLEDKLKKLT
jgi:hypothetical protein